MRTAIGTRLALGLIAASVLLGSGVARAELPPLHVQRGADPAIVDSGGREVLLRGVNVNQLGDYYQYDLSQPTVIPLRRSDVQEIGALGFSVIRLVMSWSALQPLRGEIDDAYLARIREVVGWAREQGIYVVLDMHQDAWGRFIATPSGETCPPGLGPAVGWDGAPAWATLTDGLSTCRAADTRELAPAVAQAFTNFYADRDGIQSELVGVWARLASEFAADPTIAGYDLFNEPHPGWGPAVTEATLLGDFYARAIAAIRVAEHATPGGFEHIAFFEPSVAWSGFGLDTSPRPAFTTDKQIVFAPHLYAESITIDQRAGVSTVSIENGWAIARRVAALYGAPLWSGEWGWFGPAERDLPRVERYLLQEDRALAGGAWWVWQQACGDPHVAGAPSFSGSLHPRSCPGDRGGDLAEPYARALSRAYPRFAPGRLTALQSDIRTGRFRVSGRAGSRSGSCRLEVWVPRTAVEPQATGVTGIEVLAVPGGSLVRGCARGAYELRG